jgi:hypothetical protein
VPVPDVIVKDEPVFEQEPALEKVTALPEPPPVAATAKPVPKTADAGACVVTVIAWSAFETVSELEPLLGSRPVSPANEAPTPVGYEPALIPERLTLLTVATPLPFVVALPALEPLRVKATLSPETGLPPEVRVAESVVVPPKVPLAGLAARLVALVGRTSWKQTWTLEIEGVTEPLVVDRNASYSR